jgi:hypothetical protein
MVWIRETSGTGLDNCLTRPAHQGRGSRPGNRNTSDCRGLAVPAGRRVGRLVVSKTPWSVARRGNRDIADCPGFPVSGFPGFRFQVVPATGACHRKRKKW